MTPCTSGQSVDERTVSVCVATYNGQDFVEEQLTSILSQLRAQDEVIVVDDASHDATVDIVRALQDSRIAVHARRDNLGHVATFAEAIARSTGDVIILSDQDDVWQPGRVADALDHLQSSALVASNFRHMPHPGGEPSPLVATDRAGLPDLLALYAGKRAYYGSTMAFTREFADVLLPLPRGTEAHDHWMAILGIVDGSLAHSERVVVARRLHESNLSSRTRRALPALVRTRLTMVRLTLTALARTRGRRAQEGRRP